MRIVSWRWLGVLLVVGAVPFAAVLKLDSMAESPSGISYYVDSKEGNDSNSGTDPSSPWKSLAQVNRTIFRPGDAIFLKSGSAWKEQLWPKGSGTEGWPLKVDKYGGEAKPLIEGDGEVTDAVKLYNQQYWEIRNLEITNHGLNSGVRRGVHIIVENYGSAHHILLSELSVHDVNGDLNEKDNGGIVWRCLGDQVPSRFVDLRIQECQVYHVDRSGIVASSTHWDRAKWFPSLKVVIARNTLNDIGGDGITPWACDGAVIEHNVVSDCNSRSDTYNAGVWPWSCDNTIVQFNEVFRTHHTKDGQGFDSDWNSRNTVIQYNYSHDNEGGFLLICNDGSQPSSASVGNVGTVVRYNISQNDGSRIFHIPGPVKNSRIYNNTIYVGKNLDVSLLLMSDWNGWAEDTRFCNNLFYVEGATRYGHAIRSTPDGLYELAPGLEPAQGTVFDYNLYYGNHLNRPEDTHALMDDPLLAAPGSGATGWGSLLGYRLLAGSKAIDSGLPIESNGGWDFFGFSLPAGQLPDRGACEYRTDRQQIEDRFQLRREEKREPVQVQ